MKIILIILILFIAIPLSARENIYGLRYDYILHFETGFIMSACLARWYGHEDHGVLSVGIPVILGLTKECFIDKKFSRADMGMTVLGAITGKFMSYSF